jgi:hypothetical protein
MIRKLKETTVDRALRHAADEDFTEIVLVGFKDGDFHVFSSGLEKRSQTVGALEIIKHEIMSE